MARIATQPVPCAHIHAYYKYKWLHDRSLGSNLLRIGYLQCALGEVDTTYNNLYYGVS